MRIDLENLPSDPMLLQRLVRDMAAAVETRETEIGRLQEIIRKLQRLQFGRRSERMTGGLDADQLDLALEDLDGDVAALREAGPAVVARSPERAPHRKPLPDHVPREEVVLAPESGTCSCCGEALQPAGESGEPLSAIGPRTMASHCPPLVRGQWRARCWTGFRRASG